MPPPLPLGASLWDNAVRISGYYVLICADPLSEPMPMRVVVDLFFPQLLELDWRQVAKRTVKTFMIVLLSPLLEEHLGPEQ